MQFRRASGILLHPTSLPGRFGIGDFGEEAYRFVELLAETSQHFWQMMPLGPTGYGDSPYASFSAFAGNPLLISLEALVEENLLPASALEDVPAFPTHQVDFGWVIHYKFPLLKASYAHFKNNSTTLLHEEFSQFCRQNQDWLDDFALFMALKEAHNLRPWTQWKLDIATRQPAALTRWKKRLADEINAHRFFQFLFFRQWTSVKKYANENDIQIIGDIPIFVAHDSADVWSHPELFYLDEAGNPTIVAGVPPDYFSETGQLWGNPLYRWDRLKKQNYDWWIARIKNTLTMVDIIRLDHFRGFEAYWEVPADETTAVNGRWVAGPGADLFKAIGEALGEMIPIIAEDLGVITPEVEDLRDMFGFPGMRVLQFAFTSDSKNRDLPHWYTKNCVVYTGTHDNDTAVGWYLNSGTPHEHDYFRRYAARSGHDACWDLIRLALSSVANMAIIPLQDVLALNSDARMNFPSKPSGNWTWRFTADMVREDWKQRLTEMVYLFGRA